MRIFLDNGAFAWLPGQEEKWKDDPPHELHEAIWRANLGAWPEGADDGSVGPGGS